MFDTFWVRLKKAFKEPDGFTVIFFLTGGQRINASISEPYWPQLTHFEGTDIESNLPVTIRPSGVIAYEIEE